MKRVVIGIFISMVMIGSVLANATVVNNDIEFEDGEITISIEIGDYEIENNGEGIDITVENFGHYLVAGKPNLPSRIFQIAIPPGSEFVDMTFSTGEGIVLQDSYYVLPCKLPQVIGKEDPLVREKEEKIYQENYESIYNGDEAYPSSNVEFVRTGGFRKYNLVDVRVLPFSYKPFSGELTYFPEFTITVSYTYPEGFSAENIMDDNILEIEQKAEQIVYNYNQAKDWYPIGTSGKQSSDFVIITLDSLTSSVQPLVQWEEMKGKSVYVATTSWIGSSYSGYDLAEKMRNFLLEKYPSAEWGILDVCLIGSYDDVPIRLTAQNTGYGQPETDYYFAELSLPDSQSWDADGDHQYGEDSDPVDFTAEVNVGRIPWSDPDTVEHIIQKSIAYEENDDPAFKKNILLIGTFFWADTDNAALMEYKTDPEIHPWMEDWTRTTMYEEAESSYECDYDVSYAKVEELWSEGSFAFVDWAGHGSPTACYELYPSQPFVDTYTCLSLNDDYPAIVFADACSNSDTEYDNIGQMMLKQGAVGFLGSTKVAYGMHAWDDPLDGSSQSLDYWFTTCCTSGEYTQGQAHQYALYQMYINDLWYYQRLEAFEWGALWGNPDLTMGPVVTSDPPATPATPEGPAKGAVGYEYMFSSETTDPNGDQIFYMFDWGDGDFSEWVGPFPSGETGKASHIWNNDGYFDVSVKARDEYGAKSDWSEATTIQLVYDNPPDNPSIRGPVFLFPKISYEFDISTNDPDDEDVFYWIEWGDGEIEEWIGPYSSGEEFTLSHSYEKGEYMIVLKAKDTMDIESGVIEKYIRVSFSRNRILINPFLQRLIQTFFNQLPLFK